MAEDYSSLLKRTRGGGEHHPAVGQWQSFRIEGPGAVKRDRVAPQGDYLSNCYREDVLVADPRRNIAIPTRRTSIRGGAWRAALARLRVAYVGFVGAGRGAEIRLAETVDTDLIVPVAGPFFVARQGIVADALGVAADLAGGAVVSHCAVWGAAGVMEAEVHRASAFVRRLAGGRLAFACSRLTFFASRAIAVQGALWQIAPPVLGHAGGGVGAVCVAVAWQLHWWWRNARGQARLQGHADETIELAVYLTGTFKGAAAGGLSGVADLADAVAILEALFTEFLVARGRRQLEPGKVWQRRRIVV